MNGRTTGGEPICVIYHDGHRVWPPSPPPPLDPCNITIWPTSQPPPEPQSRNRHERRCARKVAVIKSRLAKSRHATR